jgi:hypothetical protein
MSIRKWHPGKLIILWAWGGILAALALTDFQSRPVWSAPILHLVEFVFTLFVLLLLSGVTWYWLGGKERTTNYVHHDSTGKQ